MLLHRRDQGLDDKDVALPAIGLELHAEAVVGIALGLRWQQRNVEVGTDLRRQQRMRATTEDSDFGQRPQTQGDRTPGDRHLSNDFESRITTRALYRFACSKRKGSVIDTVVSHFELQQTLTRLSCWPLHYPIRLPESKMERAIALYDGRCLKGRPGYGSRPER